MWYTGLACIPQSGWFVHKPTWQLTYKRMYSFHWHSVDTFKIPDSILDNPWSPIDIQGLRYLLNYSRNLHAFMKPDTMRPSFASLCLNSTTWDGRNPSMSSKEISFDINFTFFVQSIRTSHKLFLAFSTSSNCNSENPTTLLHSYSCYIPRPPHSPYFTTTPFIKQCLLLVFSLQSLHPLTSSSFSNKMNINSSNVTKIHITSVSPIFNISNQHKYHINNRFLIRIIWEYRHEYCSVGILEVDSDIPSVRLSELYLA